MSSESIVQRKVWKRAASYLMTLFRLNTGKAWISSLGPAGVKKLTDGSVLIQQPRPIAIGLAFTNGEPVNGACDLPGWTELTITQEMVGKKVAVFTSIENKATTGGRVTPDQKNWMNQVQQAGGIAGVVNSEEALQQVYDDYMQKMKSPILL